MYTRRALAEKWGMTPWQVDHVPMDEIYTELKISGIEAEIAALPDPRGRPASRVPRAGR